MAEKTHYDTLEVAPTATQAEIAEAYRILASAWHPDRFPQGGKYTERANEKMKQINAAYQVLKDPQQRAEYDRELQQHGAVSPQEPPRPRFTPEQEREIERNRQRYHQALRSASLRKFCDALGLEEVRQRALANLENYQVELAKELLARFMIAAQ